MSTDRTPVHDDSHARAILKGELRRAFSHENEYLKHVKPPPISLTKSARWLSEDYSKSLGDLMILHTITATGRTSKKTKELIIHLGLEGDDIEQTLPQEGYLLLNMTIMEPIKAIRNNFKQGFDTYDLCMVSTHLLERIIRREQAHTLAEITLHLIPLSTMFLTPNLDLSGMPDKYIVLTARGYYVMKKSDDRDLTIALSWIPRASYTPQQEAKLTLISSQLDDDSFVFPADEFNDAKFIDPLELNQNKHVRLVGSGGFLPKPGTLRKLVISQRQIDALD